MATFLFMKPRGYKRKGEKEMNLVLNHEGFESRLVTRRSLWEGVQYIFRFENNYGASIVKHNGSYSHRSDLWELAVIKFDDGSDGSWDLNYDTPITNDVIGGLTDEEVRGLLQRIKEL
jgi:hypothetical protein